MQSVFPNLKHPPPTILVIGDVMIDHTILGNATKLANEGPIPVLHESNETWTLGGCGNVAVNCKALGAKVYLCSMLGTDESGGIARQLLDHYEIEWIGISSKEHPTTTKHRGFADSKLMFRYDQEAVYKQNMFSVIDSLLAFFQKNHIDAVIFSDYNKGFCDMSLISTVLYQCKERNIPTVVDPKGDFRKYAGCTVLKPNRDEATKFIQKYLPSQTLPSDSQANLDTLHRILLEACECKYTCITMAKEGLTIREGATGIVHRAKTQPIEVIDVTGAGDVVNAVLGYCLAVKFSMEMTAKSASFLATQSVQHKGTYVLKPHDFMALALHLKPSKRLTKEDFGYLQREGKTVVFTNGCFDLVHAGHVQSLKFAKEQGDVLVLGVNSDASIKSLKGPSRPILTLEERLGVLEALECVDYVCVMEEDSPVDLVKALQPDVLVKGEDYRGKEIKSSEFVKRVVLAPLKPMISTTSIITRILSRRSLI